MILTEPYEGKNLKFYNLKGVDEAINKYVVIDYAYLSERGKVKFKPFTGEYIDIKTVVLYGLTESESEVIPLDHPHYIKNEIGILDLRKYLKNDTNRESVSIKNESEYRLVLVRYTLSSLWKVGHYSSVYALDLAHSAFAVWMSDNLTHKFGLDLGTKAKLKALSTIFYRRLFVGTVEEDELDKLLIRSKNDIIFPELLKDVHSKVPDMSTIDDFCKACYEVTDNVRLKGLDYTVLINIVGNNWFGPLGKELAVLSLEHPPTWVSLVYISLTQSAYKKTLVATVTQKLGKRGKDSDFVRQVEILTKNYLEE